MFFQATVGQIRGYGTCNLQAGNQIRHVAFLLHNIRNSIATLAFLLASSVNIFAQSFCLCEDVRLLISKYEDGFRHIAKALFFEACFFFYFFFLSLCYIFRAISCGFLAYFCKVQLLWVSLKVTIMLLVHWCHLLVLNR